MPFSIMVAVPCALLAVALKFAAQRFGDSDWAAIFLSARGGRDVATAAYSGFTFLIGFLVVFRAQQAYARFWEGCGSVNNMQGEWFDAASSLVAFTKNSRAEPRDVITFQNVLIRLLSLLMGAVLVELSVGSERKVRAASSMATARAFELEIIDAGGFDAQTLATLNASTARVELIFQWVQQLVVSSNHAKVFNVDAPILSRCFQELANGMVQYRSASKIARVPLPFPYVQATELLLVTHWLLTPPLIAMWVPSPTWAGILTVVQVTFFWALNAIASELENPFGEDANDLPAQEMQEDFNERLLLLICPSTERTAQLSGVLSMELRHGALGLGRGSSRMGTTLTARGVNNSSDYSKISSRRSSLGDVMMSHSLESLTPIQSESNIAVDLEANVSLGSHEHVMKVFPTVVAGGFSSSNANAMKSEPSSTALTGAGLGPSLATHTDAHALRSEFRRDLDAITAVCREIRDELKSGGLSKQSMSVDGLAAACHRKETKQQHRSQLVGAQQEQEASVWRKSGTPGPFVSCFGGAESARADANVALAASSGFAMETSPRLSLHSLGGAPPLSMSTRAVLPVAALTARVSPDVSTRVDAMSSA